MNDDEVQQRRDAIARTRFGAAEVAHLDADGINDLATGREVDNALEAGLSVSDVAAQIGCTVAVALDLQRRYRRFLDECAARHQITLF